MNQPSETMNYSSSREINQVRCFESPAGFVEFKREEIEQSIADRFAQQVAQYPDRIAVKSKHEVLTYDALDKTANRVARAIRALCGDGDEPVALLFEQGAAVIAAMLAVSKAGKIDVPLDSVNPVLSLSEMLEDSQADLIVADKQNFDLAKELAANRLQVLKMEDMDVGLSEENLNLHGLPEAPARIIYTSGSTGRPKGVVLSHRRILHEVMTNINGCYVRPDDRVSLLTSPSTSQGTVITYTALLSGAALCLFNLRQEGLTSLAAWLNKEEITVYTSVRTIFRLFASTLASEQNLPHLRLIGLGGDPVRKGDVELYKRHFSDNCVLKIFLSSTETGNLSQYAIDKKTEITTEIVPVGYASDGVEILLLDEKGKQVGCNEMGEIAVRSRYLALGYWRRPDLSDAKFRPDPDDAEERIYLTGDLGRRLPDGCLEYLGRKDFRVKIRGYGVETGEIESALLTNQRVRETIVVATDGPDSDARLVAYVVPADLPGPASSELRDFLSNKLPEYMVPSTFVMLDALPLTPNGKVDRRALPAPDQGRPELGKPFVAPRDDLEVQLTKIWEKVLGHEAIGVRDNFFEVGGHSLRAVQVVHQIGEVFGKTLPVIALFQAPTVEQLAEALRDEDPSRDWASVVPLQPNGSKPPFFFLAGRSHFGDRLGPDQPVYRVVYQDLDREQPFVRVEDMAAHAIKSVRRIQPDGPYYLGGHGLGGMVAFEMAHRLQRQGQKVALLALCECWILDSRPPTPGTSLAYRLWQRASYHVHRTRRVGTTQELAHLLKNIKKKTQGAWRRQSAPLTRSQQGHRAALFEAFGRYMPQVYSGRISVIRCAERVPWRDYDPLNGWGSLAADGVEAYEIPGSHAGIYKEPNVGMLVRTLNEVLHKAQARTKSERKALADPNVPLFDSRSFDDLQSAGTEGKNQAA